MTEYDFTNPVPQNMDRETRAIYYRLRRRARETGGEMPDGRVLTAAEVAALLDVQPEKKDAAEDD